MLVYKVVPGIFRNCKTTLISFSHLPALFLAAAHRQRRRRRRGASSRPSRPLLRFALAPTRRSAPPPPPVASRWSFPGRATRAAEPRSVRAATTSPSRWQAHCRARRPLLASARALHIPQKSIPCTPLLSPRSHASERRRRTTPNPGELTPAAEPPHRRSSARSDPLASTASPSRNSPTASPSPNPHRSTLSVACLRRRAALLRRAAASEPLPATLDH